MKKLVKITAAVLGGLIIFWFSCYALASMSVDRIYKNDTYHFTIKYRATALSYFLPVPVHRGLLPGEIVEYDLQGNPPFSVAVVKDKIKFDVYFAHPIVGGGCSELKSIQGYFLYICADSGSWPALQEHMPQ